MYTYIYIYILVTQKNNLNTIAYTMLAPVVIYAGILFITCQTCTKHALLEETF